MNNLVTMSYKWKELNQFFPQSPAVFMFFPFYPFDLCESLLFFAFSILTQFPEICDETMCKHVCLFPELDIS